MQSLLSRFWFSRLALAFLITSAAYGQSLGDVARENREKKSAEDNSTASPKVITNKDLPKDADANQEPAEENSKTDAEASATTAEQRAAHRSAQQRLAEQRAANQWKRQILAQKNRVAALQARIDQFNAETSSTYGSVQYEPPYGRSQNSQIQRVSQMQQKLDEQKARLADMQESARRAGMHTTVYDP